MHLSFGIPPLLIQPGLVTTLQSKHENWQSPTRRSRMALRQTLASYMGALRGPAKIRDYAGGLRAIQLKAWTRGEPSARTA